MNFKDAIKGYFSRYKPVGTIRVGPHSDISAEEFFAPAANPTKSVTSLLPDSWNAYSTANDRYAVRISDGHDPVGIAVPKR